MRRWSQRYFGVDALVVDPTTNAGMPILYENPAEVGADRIANASPPTSSTARAAERPLIVADLGTATTFDAVTAQGRVSRRRDLSRAADCRRSAVSARGAAAARGRAQAGDASSVGRRVGAIESGLFYGYLGMVEGLMTRMSVELGGNAICIATGGLAPVIAPETPLIQHVDGDLTLHGLRIVWERNRDRRGLLPRDRNLPLSEERGHLIRVVGPSFEIVSGWAAQGVPLKVAFAGIDRYFERYYRKGPRRRPVKIDFCDADVLDAFDEWRRALGLGGARAFRRAMTAR